MRDQFSLPFSSELIIDNFAGGGGTSEGLEQAFGRPVDIAINHDPEALAMHAINHPYTKHLCESVWDVDPIEVTGNQPVGLVWLSPDCKHFSKAKGGTPVEKKIRGLAWVGMRWAALTKPRVMMLENVEEFQDWGPLIIDADGTARPDPAKKGKTFESFVRQLRGHGYTVDWRELRACDNDAPTIRKRLFLIARRDGLPIEWPEQTNGDPMSPAVLAGKLKPWRTAAECIDFTLPAESIFARKKPLVHNTHRRVAKGLWRHVLTSAKPFIVGVGGRMGQSPARGVDQPVQTITSKADSCLATPVLAPFVGDQSRPAEAKTAGADEPLRTQCAQVKGGHFTLVAPTLAPMRGTSDSHMNGHDLEAPLSTISAGGTHHGLVGANLITIGYGEREGQEPRVHDIERPMGTVVAGGVKQAVSLAHLTKFRTGSQGVSLEEPMPTVTANSFVKRPGGAAPLGLVAAHLTHLTHHGERSGYGVDEPFKTITGANRGEQAVVAACLEQAYGGFYEGNPGRAVDEPLSTVMSKGANQRLISACLEQANGGFYEGDGRAADAPMSTVTSSGKQQRLITAYCVKYYSNGGQWQGLDDPMHTLPTKGRMGLVQTMQVSADALSAEHLERAKLCAELLREHLPEHFTDEADMVLVQQFGTWWVLVDITLRMLKPRELFNAQGFPQHYVIHEIPDPALLFKGGVQAADPLTLPRVPLTATAQVRMCGNSVSPKQAKALALANFKHEAMFGSRRQNRRAA